VIGVFVTLNPPTKPMMDEAFAAGYYAPEHLGKQHTAPKIQIVTIDELLSGKEIQYPRMLVSTFKKAQRKYKEIGPTQDDLL
jgi:site-specific DNA-methyltransferase (adenine-specific)